MFDYEDWGGAAFCYLAADAALELGEGAACASVAEDYEVGLLFFGCFYDVFGGAALFEYGCCFEVGVAGFGVCGGFF